jgi:hypothetical protein
MIPVAMRRAQRRLGCGAACFVAFHSGCASRNEATDSRDAADDAPIGVDAPEGCAAAPCPVVLATAPAAASICLDASRAYFTSCSESGGEVLAVPRNGGPASTLARGSGCPVAIAVDTTGVYAAGLDGPGAVKIAFGGGPLSPMLESADPVRGIALDSTRLFVTTEAGDVLTAPLGGGPPARLAGGPENPSAPATDGEFVYWGEPRGAVRRAPAAGGDVETVTEDATEATALAVARGFVYVASGYTLLRVKVTGGATEWLATAAGAPIFALASDGTRMLFTSYDTLFAVPLGGGPTTPLATDLGAPNAIAADAAGVYITAGFPWPDEDRSSGQVLVINPR